MSDTPLNPLSRGEFDVSLRDVILSRWVGGPFGIMAVGMVSVKDFVSIVYVLSYEWEVVTGWDLLIIGPSIIMKFYQGCKRLGCGCPAQR